jgi:membrane protease YdiL (CAAX protease family)
MQTIRILRAGTSPRKASPAVLLETLVVLVLVIAATLFNKGLGTFASLAALAYLLIERQLRHRSWDELGLSLKGFWPSLKQNWPLILLVSVIIQLIVAGVARMVWPDLLAHIMARLPFEASQLLAFLPLLLVATLLEELIYRALFQERLSWFVPLPAALAGVTMLFGLAHFSPGPWSIVLADIGLVMVDSLLYGLIFARGRNVLVAWLAHLLADVVAILLIVAW